VVRPLTSPPAAHPSGPGIQPAHGYGLPCYWRVTLRRRPARPGARPAAARTGTS